MTVVVMGYCDRRTIVDAVASVLAQRSPEPFDVVVVTSGRDGSGDAVRAAFGDVTVVESDARLLPGGTRNVGVRATTAELVAFLAADCLAEPGWVAARLAAHRAGHPVVAGAMTTAAPQRPSAWALHFDLYGARLPGRAEGPLLPGDPAAHGLSFARVVLDRVGPFDEHTRVGEDTDIARRLAPLGVPIWFAPRVRTAHRGPTSTRALLAERYRRGAMAARNDGVSAPAASPMRLLAALPARWVRRVTSAVATGWRYGRGERLRLLAALPWLAAGRAAGLAGWYREQRRPSSP